MEQNQELPGRGMQTLRKQSQEQTRCKPTGAVRNRRLPLLGFVRCTRPSGHLSAPKESHSCFQPILTATHSYSHFSYLQHYHQYLLWSSHPVWISTHKGRGQRLEEEPLSSWRTRQHEETQQSTWQQQGVGSAAPTLASRPNLQCLELPRLPEKPNKPLPCSWTSAASHCGQPLWFLTSP